MTEKTLRDEIRQSNYGVITLKDGNVSYKTLNSENRFKELLCKLYMKVGIAKTKLCSKNDYLRKLCSNDVKAVWSYRGLDLKFLGLRSKKGCSISDMRKVISSIDDIADIKETGISCATNINPEIMERLGYQLSTKTSDFSYYVKNRK